MTTESHEVAPVRILVVEDEVIVARDICVQLTELGYTALADTAYGEEAIALAEQHRPDLVLMDVNLAGAMDGITAAREIRARLDLPVVFLTAYANRETLNRAKEAQPFGYIIKPFAEEELRTVIEMALFKYRAEQKQRATDARYRALTESANDAIITIDREGLIVGWNQGATRIYGFTEGEVMGRQLMPLIVPARLHEEYIQRMSRVMASVTNPGPGTLEAAGKRKDGSEFPIEMSLAQWDTQDGRFFTTIIRDITERKQLEQQMRLQSAALASAVNSVVITDTAGDIVWVNPAFCRVTGYAFAEVIGRNPRILKSGLHAPEFYAGMWRAITAGQSWQGELVNRRKDGSLLNESVSITPVKDEGGRVTHFIAIKQDITALKKSLGELSATHAVLAEKNRALDAALVEARAAVEAKATFLATMSHEIRTPMNGVIGMASLLRETAPLTEEQADYIDTIRSSGETLLTLINDVLDFSKIESGNMELEQIPFDLRRCIEETLEMLAPRARQKRLDLAAEIEGTVPPAIIGDAVRLRQVITNLVGNAVKLSKPLRQQHLLEAAARACALTPAMRTPRMSTPATDELRATAQHHPRRILVAEDNPVNRKVALAMLSRLGYEAEAVVNGVEAMAACRDRSYDLVLMEVQMPEIDGLEATRRIRRLNAPQPVVVAMTANAMEGDRATCLNAGMDDYISKPIKIEDLQRVVSLPLRPSGR